MENGKGGITVLRAHAVSRLGGRRSLPALRD
jgi:hypothetical protein